jgi:hypothetical protein
MMSAWICCGVHLENFRAAFFSFDVNIATFTPLAFMAFSMLEPPVFGMWAK